MIQEGSSIDWGRQVPGRKGLYHSSNEEENFTSADLSLSDSLYEHQALLRLSTNLLSTI